MAKKRKFLDFLDMIDGGGKGQMGDEFEGGGLLSVLANMAASPYGSEDEMRRKARQDFYSSQNIGGGPQVGSARVSRPMARPAAPVSFADMEGQYSTSPAAPVSFADMEGQYSSAPASSYAPAAQTALAPIDQFGGMQPAFTEANSFATFVSGLGPEALNNTLGDILEAHRLHMQGYSN
jgi:hypothetical protein